jgi:hypothetical protein
MTPPTTRTILNDTPNIRIMSVPKIRKKNSKSAA